MARDATGDDCSHGVTRGTPDSVPSVVRRGRLNAHMTIAVFAVSCVVAIVGLTLITMALITRR